MFSVCITSAGTKIGLIKAFQEAGAYVVAIDSDPLCPAKYFADEFDQCPDGTGDEFGDYLYRLHDHVDMVVPTRDAEIPYIASKLYVKSFMVVPEFETAYTCYNKKSFNEFCLSMGFAIPEPDIFPAFVRPIIGSGNKNTYIAQTENDVKNTQCVVQEYIEADEYSVDLFVDDWKNVISVVPRLRIKVKGGESWVGRTVKDWDIINECVRLAEALNLFGHNVIQCFKHDGKTKFIEVNTRYGGGSVLSFMAGANSPKWLIDIAQEKEVRPRIGEFEEDLYMMRYTDNIYV